MSIQVIFGVISLDSLIVLLIYQLIVVSRLLKQLGDLHHLVLVLFAGRLLLLFL